jgi:hypothetical protein
MATMAAWRGSVTSSRPPGPKDIAPTERSLGSPVAASLRWLAAVRLVDSAATRAAPVRNRGIERMET